MDNSGASMSKYRVFQKDGPSFKVVYFTMAIHYNYAKLYKCFPVKGKGLPTLSSGKNFTHGWFMDAESDF